MSDVALGADGIEYIIESKDHIVPDQEYLCKGCTWPMVFKECKDKSNHFAHLQGANLLEVSCEYLTKYNREWEKSGGDKEVNEFLRERHIDKVLGTLIKKLYLDQFIKFKRKEEEKDKELVHIQKKNMKLQEEVTRYRKKLYDSSYEIAQLKDIIQDLEDKVASKDGEVKHRIVHIKMHD
jgi:competence CoiA-like predicted nuclease